MGGVARRATVIKGVRAQGGQVLLLDAGNSLVATLNEAGSREPALSSQGRTSVEALSRLGYDAVALGPKDLLLGKAELHKRIAEARGFGFVSANLQDRATGKLVASSYVTKEIGGHRLALIGITGPIPESDEFAVAVPMDAARDYVAQVQSKADVVILVSSAGAEVNKAIAEQVPGIDLIICGGQELLAEPWRPQRGALVVQADRSLPGHAGRVVGKLVAEFDRSGVLIEHKWETTELKPAIADDREMLAWVRDVSAQE